MSRTVAVVGGGQGIGRTCALQLADEGHTVIVADRDAHSAAAVTQEITERGGRAHTVRVDVSDAADTERFHAAIADITDELHGLVHCAAIFSTLRMRPFWEIDVTEWDAVMSVNVKGFWLTVKALLPLLRNGEAASIVAFASDAVWMGRSGYLHYVASKSAVAGMAYSLARELGLDDIRVNAVSPGPIATEIERETVSASQRIQIQSAQSLKRSGTADDIAGIVSFLLSRQSSWITGQVVHANGGLLHL